MKKTIQALLLSLLVLFAVPFNVYADEHETDESDDIVSEREAKILSHTKGAEMRILQLQKRISHQITLAEHVIERIDNIENSSINTETLNSIVEELETLVSNIENIDYSQSAENLAEEYVEYKAQAIELSKQFKDTIADELSDEDKQAIREEIKAKHEELRKEKHERINEKRKELHIEKIEEILEKLGVENSILIEQIQNEEITIKDAQKELRKIFSELSNEDKKELRENLREENQKHIIKAKTNKEKFMKLSQENRDNLRERFLEAHPNLKQRLENMTQEEKDELRSEIKERTRR